MKLLRLFLNIPIATANAVVAVVWIASAYSDRVAPSTSLFFSYLGLAFPFICLIMGCFLLYWAFAKELKFFLYNLLVVAFCWVPLRNYFPLHFEKEIPTENTLKVLTYNIMGFAYKDHTPEAPNPILEYIIHSQADIVCLQEYNAAKSGKRLTEKKVYDALKMYPYHAVVRLGTPKRPSHSIAVFSKYPIQKSKRINYPSDANGSSYHLIKIKGKTLALINNHLESFKLTSEDKSRYTSFIKTLGSEEFDNLKGTVQQKLGTAYRKRAQQADALSQFIQKIKSDYLLVCGDFNDTPISYAHRKIQGDLKDAFSEAGNGIGVTYNQNFFWFKIDHILYSRNMEALACQIDKVDYSDHYPIWSIFLLK